MAIQTRRGNYANFDPDKMLPGELATVTSGDPGAKDGRSVYACFAAGDVKRMATYEDMEENIDRATQDVQEAFSAQLTQKISQADTAISQAQTATSAANTAAQGADEAKQEALEAAAAAESYVLGDISDKTVTFSEASARANIDTGESTSTLFGKIKKWFSDLKAFAFSDLAQDTETDDENRAASAAVTSNLQGKINELNTKINFAAGLPSIGLSGTPSHIAILNAMDAKGVSLLLLTAEELAGVTGLTGTRWGIGLVATKKGSFNRNAFIMIDQADIHYGLYAHSNNETFIKKITGSQI